MSDCSADVACNVGTVEKYVFNVSALENVRTMAYQLMDYLFAQVTACSLHVARFA